jgi:glycosyltransferase involved in cell wall biosynthesis
MEIIHLILGKANPERMNGVNKVVYQMATRQQNAGKKVTVWGITKDLSHNYGERNFKTILFQAHKNPFKIDSVLKKELIKNQNNIVVHLHGGWVPIYASLARFLKKNNISFVLTPHGAYNTIAMQRSGITKKLYFQLFEKTLLKNAKRIHSLGQSEVIGLHELYPNTKSFLLPYGFETPKNLPNKITNQETFIIGFVGRLDIYTKGLDILIMAYKRFVANVPNSELWIVGDSNERTELETLITSNQLNEKVKLFGSKFGTEKDELISQMSIFTHPSRNEGIPTAVLEACAIGIPSVVSKATNIADYIQKYNAGIAIPDENIDELQHAFESLYKKWQTSEMDVLSENAKKLVREAFDWNTLVNQLDELYK